MKGMLSMLLVGATCVFGGMALGVSALMREQTRHRQFRERVALVTGGYARVTALSVMGRGAAVADPTRKRSTYGWTSARRASSSFPATPTK